MYQSVSICMWAWARHFSLLGLSFFHLCNRVVGLQVTFSSKIVCFFFFFFKLLSTVLILKSFFFSRCRLVSVKRGSLPEAKIT